MKIRYSFLVLVIGLIFLIGCSSNESPATGNAVFDSPVEVNVNKLEIYHFHGTNQCYSCITVGNYAEETVNTYFKDELEKGIIVFDHINIDLSENRDLVVRYGATGSSLWLGTYKRDKFNSEQNTNVWYKIKDKQDYMNYLKGIIEQKLAGN